MLEVLVNIHVKALYRTFAKRDMHYIWIVREFWFRELMLKREGGGTKITRRD